MLLINHAFPDYFVSKTNCPQVLFTEGRKLGRIESKKEQVPSKHMESHFITDDHFSVETLPRSLQVKPLQTILS